MLKKKSIMKRTYLYVVLALLFIGCQSPKNKNLHTEGFIFGTVYHISYNSPQGKILDSGIIATMQMIDRSLSMFNKESTLSKINRNESDQIDSLFLEVYTRSAFVSEATQGAFDPTVAPLVNLWGFGFEKKEQVTKEILDSIMDFIGYQKLSVADGRLIKDDARIMIDYSAIAKGYAVDLVGRYLAQQGCSDYMVEIGGEVVLKGKNPSGDNWRIGINEPNENEPMDAPNFQTILSISNKAIATSGNYRNFYIDGGKKYAHTIDPHSGYPVQHTLLSASVIADECIMADAFATAFMVLGWEKALEVCEEVGLEAFFIISNGENENIVKMTPNFDKYIQK